jgi:TIR domain
MNAKVFINYRRDDTAPYAGRLYDRLATHFSEDQVVIDIDLAPGEDFVEAINRIVGTCDIAIVVIGPNWLHVTDASGKRRLDDEEDPVRMQIVAALQRKIRVVPVLVGGARMPLRDDLPEALAPLSRRNAIELSETRFHGDVNRLVELIERSLAIGEKERELSATPAALLSEQESKVLAEPTQTTPATPPVPSTSLAKMFGFLSYARADSEHVLLIAKQLRQAGAALWLDQLDIIYGDHWDRAVERALQTCDCLVVMLSAASVQSENVRDEVDYAIEKGKRIVPVLLESCEIPLRLRRRQHIDLTRRDSAALHAIANAISPSRSG